MSLKKNKFNKFDKKIMKLAINLAINQKELTGTNPSVGCVIVKNKKILSIGATNKNGRPHAETIALKNNKNKNFGSSMYLTLEPCSHYGKTPPCTKALIRSKIKEVKFSIKDIDPRSFNKSKKILNSYNILTKSGLLKKEVNNLYKIYNYTKKKKFPYIIGKLACSSNSFILNNNTSITNDHSKKVSHLLRYKTQGILTSYKTINSDNSKLTCRLNGLEYNSPTRFIIDKNLKINMNSYIVNNSKKINTFIFYNSKKINKIKKLKKKGIKLIYVDIEINKYMSLKKIFMKIYNLGIHTLLTECGKNLTNKILSQNLFNEFYLFKSNKNLHKKNKISINIIKYNLNKIFKYKKKINTYLDKDALIHYY